MRRSETLMEAKMGANFLALFNLQTYTTFFPFSQLSTPNQPHWRWFAGRLGMKKPTPWGMWV
jgi:hydroxymethylpyrimidine/phosphomethylpyrimidine kinase